MPTSRGGTDAVGDDWGEPLFLQCRRAPRPSYQGVRAAVCVRAWCVVRGAWCVVRVRPTTYVAVPRRVSALGLTDGRGGMGGRATAAPPPGEAVDDEDKVASWGRAAVVDELLEDGSPSIDGV